MLKRAAIAITRYLVAAFVGLGGRPYADEPHGTEKAANQKRLHWTESSLPVLIWHMLLSKWLWTPPKDLSV
jgi:hypothetical protein